MIDIIINCFYRLGIKNEDFKGKGGDQQWEDDYREE